MDARSEGLSFWEIDDSKHRFLTDQIILTISATSGASIPQSELLGSYLSDEIIWLLQDRYSDYTVEEIILAVRMNCLKGWRNPNNGEFLDRVEPTISVCVIFLADVLHYYSILRNHLDRMIENKIQGY